MIWLSILDVVPQALMWAFIVTACLNLFLTSQICQFSISFYEALAKKPKPIFGFREIIASGHSFDSKRARLENGHISKSQFEIMRWNSFNFAIAKERIFSLAEVPFITEKQA